MQKLLNEVSGWVKTVVVGLILFVMISIFLFQPYTVNGSSMEPTFTGYDAEAPEQKGDIVLVLKSLYKPKYGDVVVIDSRVFRERTIKDEWVEHPLLQYFFDDVMTDHKWIKRVIGEPGDTIEIYDGTLYRNGTTIKEDYILEDMKGYMGEITIPEDHVFVLGDNRNFSGDSRLIGPVPVENVIGKVIARYYPLQKLGLF